MIGTTGRVGAVVLAASLVTGLAATPVAAGHGHRGGQVRFATFNASLNRGVEGELVADLAGPDDPQAAAVAEIIQRVRPDVLLLNEFDFDPDGQALALFQDNYLSVPHHGTTPLRPRSAGVFWPTPDDPLFRLVGDFDPALPGGFPSSDHRLVWIDLRV